MSRKILIGLDQFYYALLTSDTTAGVTYQTPVPLRGAIKVSYNPNSNVETLFADDGAYDTAETMGQIDLDVDMADISQEDYAALEGHTIAGGVLNELTTDQPVDCAFGFRAKRSNGGYSYYWFLKGKFNKPKTDFQTKADKINWQTPTMSWKGVARIYDGRFKSSIRDDAVDYTATIGTAWFTTVYGTAADITPPTLASSIPSADSTSATQTTNITLTFSEPILSSTITAANIMLICPTAAATISGVLTVTSGIVTMTISAILTASTSYNIILGTGLKDYSGNSLSAVETFKFTTSV